MKNKKSSITKSITTLPLFCLALCLTLLPDAPHWTRTCLPP